MDFKFWKKKEEKINEELKQNYVSAQLSFIDFATNYYNGDKTGMYSGFGITIDTRIIDLKTLQYRSLQLSRENGFGSAILGLLETKVINSGLKLRAHPLEPILSEITTNEYLDGWSNKVECLWDVWSRDKRLVTAKQDMTFQELERVVYRTSKLSGDCLVIRSFNKMGLPVIEVIDGINIESPVMVDKDIVHGVEHNANGIEAAYYYRNKKNELVEVRAYDNKGKRRAWLVRSTEKRIDERRGLPLLSVVMQNINELGKYLDSEQRAALVNSYIAVVHKKDPDQPGKTDPFTRAGTTVNSSDTTSAAKFKQMQPGYFATKLAAGESISSFDTSRPNVNFAKFFESVSKIMSFSLGIPPECLFLEFDSNYSASRQAKLELEDLIKKELAIFTGKFNQPIYEDWLDGMILSGRVEAPGYIRALSDVKMFDVIGAWRSATWRGLPKSNVDGLKQAKELEILRKYGWKTDDQITDEYFDGDWDANMRQRIKEAEKLKLVNDIITPEETDITGIDMES